MTKSTRTIAKELFEKYCIDNENPIAWHIWKMAFDFGVNVEKYRKTGKKKVNND